MKKVIVRAPVRADLAGGTLDLWPLYLFHPGSRTVNVAISYHAESEVAETGDDAIEIHLTDQQYEQRYESMQRAGRRSESGADPSRARALPPHRHPHHHPHRRPARLRPRRLLRAGDHARPRALRDRRRSRSKATISSPSSATSRRASSASPPASRITTRPSTAASMALHLNPGAVVRHPIALPVDRPRRAHAPALHRRRAFLRHEQLGASTSARSTARRRSRRASTRSPRAPSRWRSALESGDFEAAGVGARITNGRTARR